MLSVKALRPYTYHMAFPSNYVMHSTPYIHIDVGIHLSVRVLSSLGLKEVHYDISANAIVMGLSCKVNQKLDTYFHIAFITCHSVLILTLLS